MFYLKVPYLFVFSYSWRCYTKHYFEESSRICSSIGSGGFKYMYYPIEELYEETPKGSNGLPLPNIKANLKKSVYTAYWKNFNVEPYINRVGDLYDVVRHYETNNGYEPVFYYHTDHLGSASYITDDRAKVVQQLAYMPYGEEWADIRDDNAYSGSAYKFNGKEKDDETGYNYYGARYYSDRLSIWLSVDPLADKYPSLSPYAYCNNNPVMFVDPDGREVYMLFYTTDDKMFKASAETRKREIEGMRGFNSEKDKVIMFGVSDLSEIGDLVNWAIDTYSEQYGKTAEAGVWSHAGWDGLIGATPTSGDYALHDYQVSLEGWNSINFNWSRDGANMSFYGCNTGKDIAGGQWVGSFARNISEQSNFKGVNVWGQQTSSYPSFSPYIRATNFARTAGYGYGIGDTYMVGGNAGQGKQSHWFMRGNYPRANPMNVYKNGRLVRSAFQNR